MSRPLEGIFVALTTPFAGDDISIEDMRANVAGLNSVDVAGYLVLGSTGESVSLSDEESEKLVEAVVAAGAGKKVLIGTARESTRATIAFTNRFAGRGAAAALVRPPSYFKPMLGREALKRHFLAVADGSRLPVVVYNMPQYTGVNLEPQLVLELAAHPNIIGLKESSGSLTYVGEVVRDAPPGFHYLVGSGGVVYPALEMGACGAVLAVANAAPELCAEIFRLFKAGQGSQARKLQLDLIPLNKALTQVHGIAGLKYAQDLRGFHGGPVRPPLLPVDERAKTEIAALMKALGL